MAGNATAGPGLDKIHDIGVYEDAHISSVIYDCHVGVGVDVVHEHVTLFYCVFRWSGLLCRHFVESYYHCRFNSLHVVLKCAGDGLDSFCSSFVKDGQG